MSKRVIELIRVSTEGQAAADRAGIPAQRASNRRTATQFDLNIVKTIEITDVSGTAVLRSPGMQELLRLIEHPDIHGVVAKEFSRLMRPENFADYALLQHFIDSRSVLYLPDGPLDFASEAGKLLGGLRALIAGQERREMLRRLQDAKEAMRRAGKNAGGAAALPFGVGYSKQQGWYYTPEVEKVRRAFQMFLKGETSYERIGVELNMPRTNVRCIMQNPIYTGWRVYDKRRDPSPDAYVPRPDGRQGYRKKTRRAPDEIIRVRVMDPVITEADFARVQELIEVKRLKHWRARSEAPNRYTYNGFLTCGECSEPMYTHSSKHDFYVCKSRHPRERRRRAVRGLEPCLNRHMLRRKLEPKIDHVLGNMLCSKGFLEPLVDAHNEKSQTRGADIDQLAATAQIHSLGEKRERILDAFFDGMITKQERDARVEQVEREVAIYERLLLETADSTEKPSVLDLDAVLAIVEPFSEWTFLDRRDKRRLLGLLCPDISVSRYEIRALQLNLGPQTRTGNEGSHLKTGMSPSRVPPCHSPFPPDSCWRRQ